ncbi:MAG: hypothetical protein WC979_04745 [Candidatus Pacearchaeota archaeon]|jgi:hypothetical protein
MENNCSKDWEENKLIGNSAENIVGFLINSAPGWKGIKYGIEQNIDELKSSLRNNNQEEISKKIRSMPDFIAVNKEKSKVLLIEAKFRSFIDRRESGIALYNFNYARIKDYLQFWPETYLIVVHNHEPYFNVIPLKDVEWHKHFYGRTGEGKGLKEQWNFAGIQKEIKDLFPELPESAIKKAIEMIPKNTKVL